MQVRCQQVGQGTRSQITLHRWEGRANLLDSGGVVLFRLAEELLDLIDYSERSQEGSAAPVELADVREAARPGLASEEKSAERAGAGLGGRR